MRLEIILKPDKYKFQLPINYNFPLSAAIYKVYNSFAPQFADWLHNQGFRNSDGKIFKLFTFSRLFFYKKEIQGDIISAEGNVRFYFSSPLADTLINNFVFGLLNSKNITIANHKVRTNFKIEKVSILALPEFRNEMNYKMLSPTVSSIQEIFNERKQTKFLNPASEKVKQVLTSNLLNKYYIIYDRPDIPDINIEFDHQYIDRQGGVDKIMKLITIKEAKEGEIKIKGYLTPIKIITTPAMQRIAYYCGIGERNSLGFGCLEIT